MYFFAAACGKLYSILSPTTDQFNRVNCTACQQSHKYLQAVIDAELKGLDSVGYAWSQARELRMRATIELPE